MKNTNSLDWFMYLLIGAILIIFAIVIAFSVTAIVYNVEHPCIKSHEEVVHKEAYTSFVMSGKILVPIHHPARDVTETICDERKGQN